MSGGDLSVQMLVYSTQYVQHPVGTTPSMYNTQYVQWRTLVPPQDTIL